MPAQTSSLQTLIKFANFYARFTPSFTQIGYIARGLPFRPVRGDFTGRTWLVTGATGGLGRAAALAAAARGAHVFAVGRSREGLASLSEAASRGAGRLSPVICDLSSMAEVAELAASPALAGARIDVLVNNVGILLRQYEGAPEGFEASYATNLLGHYILTETLFALGRFAAGPAIINVVSGGLYNVPLNTRMLDQGEARFNGFTAYASHKRAQVALADHWRTALAAVSPATYAVHPGWADTAGVKTSLPKFQRVLRPILRTAAQGVDTVLWLAAARPPHVTDRVWFDRVARTTHVYPHTLTAMAMIPEVVDYLERDRLAALGSAASTRAPAPAA